MRIPLAILLVCSLLIVPVHIPAQESSRHIIMVSIDGLRPEIYLEPERVGVQVPHLVALRDQGASAERMIPVFPSVTYPGHTTLVTGVYPAQHGIVSNFKRGAEWYLNADDIQSQTLWQAAEAQGLTTAIVTWPASYGAKVDYLIPENLAFSVENASALIRTGSTPGLFESLEEKFGTPKIPGFEMHESGEKLDAMTIQFAAEILRQHKPHLLLVHFLDADHRQHFDGPRSAAANHAFELIDGHIGTLRKAAQEAGILDATTFVVVGDHGFVPVHTSINITGLLAAIGFAESNEKGVHVSSRIRTAPIGGAAFFSVRNPADHQLAVQLASALRQEVETRYAGLISFLEPEELRRLGAFPSAVCALAASQGYMFTAAPVATPLLPSGEFTGMHGYLPTLPHMATGFIIAGPQIRQGLQIPIIRMIDVAPTVAALLGISLDDAVGLPVVGLMKSTEPGPGLGLEESSE